MPRLSIIISSLGGGEPLERSLLSILPWRPEGCEVVVAHDGGYADPYGLADEVDFVVARGARRSAAPGAELFQAGLERARGEIVLLLRGGVEASPAWTSAAERFWNPSVGAVVPGSASDEDGRSIPAEGVFFRRELLGALEGPDPRVGDDLAPLDLCLSLLQAGFECQFDPAHRVRLARRARPAWGSGGMRRSLWNARLRRRHAASEGWRTLSGAWPGWSSLLGHEAPRGAMLWLACSADWLDVGAAERQRRRVDRAARLRAPNREPAPPPFSRNEAFRRSAAPAAAALPLRKGA